MDPVQEMQLYIERRERSAQEFQICMRLWVEQRRRVSAALDLTQLRVRDGRVKKTLWGGRKDQGIADGERLTGSRTI